MTTNYNVVFQWSAVHIRIKFKAFNLIPCLISQCQQKSDQTSKCDIWKIDVYTAVYSDIMYGDKETIYSKTYYYGF